MNQTYNSERPWHRTPYDDGYASCDRTVAKFLVYPGDVEPEAISKLMGITPTSMVRLGETVINPSNNRIRVGKLNGWFLSSEAEVQSLDLRRHLDWLLDILTPREQAIKQIQALPNVRMTVHCIWWGKALHGGPTLWPKQMRSLAELDLECGFEFADYSLSEE